MIASFRILRLLALFSALSLPLCTPRSNAYPVVLFDPTTSLVVDPTNLFAANSAALAAALSTFPGNLTVQGNFTFNGIGTGSGANSSFQMFDYAGNNFLNGNGTNGTLTIGSTNGTGGTVFDSSGNQTSSGTISAASFRGNANTLTNLNPGSFNLTSATVVVTNVVANKIPIGVINGITNYVLTFTNWPGP